MARRQNTFAAIRKARATPVNAQEWTRTWIFGNYFEEYHMSTKVSRTVVLTRVEFDQLYVEPAPVAEPEATSDSSDSGGAPLPATELSVQRNAPGEWRQQDYAMAVSGFETSSATSSSDSSTSSGESDVSSDVPSQRQPRSLPELPSEQPELDEAGSGYEADSSDNDASSQMSSTTESDSSPAQYTPDVSSSDSDHAAGSSDSDSEARYISSRITAAALREYHERVNVLRANRLAELDRAIDHARHVLRTTVAHSFGEYMASVASLEALEREREHPERSNALRANRLAELEHAIDHARHVLRTTVVHSFGEYMASVVSLEALEREQVQVRSGVLYPRHQLIAGIALPGASTYAYCSGCVTLRSRS